MCKCIYESVFMLACLACGRSDLRFVRAGDDGQEGRQACRRVLVAPECTAWQRGTTKLPKEIKLADGSFKAQQQQRLQTLTFTNERTSTVKHLLQHHTCRRMHLGHTCAPRTLPPGHLAPGSSSQTLHPPPSPACMYTCVISVTEQAEGFHISWYMQF